MLQELWKVRSEDFFAKHPAATVSKDPTRASLGFGFIFSPCSVLCSPARRGDTKPSPSIIFYFIVKKQ